MLQRMWIDCYSNFYHSIKLMILLPSLKLARHNRLRVAHREVWNIVETSSAEQGSHMVDVLMLSLKLWTDRAAASAAAAASSVKCQAERQAANASLWWRLKMGGGPILEHHHITNVLNLMLPLTLPLPLTLLLGLFTPLVLSLWCAYSAEKTTKSTICVRSFPIWIIIVTAWIYMNLHGKIMVHTGR